MGPMGLCHFLPKHFFRLSHRTNRWTMLVDNVGLTICLLRILSFMVTMTFLPWCIMKWSRDEFDSQTHILQGLGWLHGPWYKQPLINTCKVYEGHALIADSFYIVTPYLTHTIIQYFIWISNYEHNDIKIMWFITYLFPIELFKVTNLIWPVTII